MHMLYNSPSFIVVQFEVQVPAAAPGELLKANPELQLNRGGFGRFHRILCTNGPSTGRDALKD